MGWTGCPKNFILLSMVGILLKLNKKGKFKGLPRLVHEFSACNGSNDEAMGLLSAGW
jgi:hypothetical protein